MMTREDLAQYRNLADAIEALDEAIEAEYNTYHSPRFEKMKTRSKDLSSPVERALQRIEGLKAERQEIHREMLTYERYVENIRDPYVRGLCRYHYIEGKSWKEASAIFKRGGPKALSDLVGKYFQSPEAQHD